MAGWGNVFGKIFDWLPGKDEATRNKIEKLKRQYNELMEKDATPVNRAKLASISAELTRLFEQAKNK